MVQSFDMCNHRTIGSRRRLEAAPEARVRWPIYDLEFTKVQGGKENGLSN